MTGAIGLRTLVRFVHVTGAVLWIGGQPALSWVVLPPARRMLPEEDRARFASAAGRRFGILTGAAFLPVQITTGRAMARHKGITFAMLAEPGYGRTLAAKLALFLVVLAAAAVHGWACSRDRTGTARALAIASLAGSLGVVLLATGLPPA